MQTIHLGTHTHYRCDKCHVVFGADKEFALKRSIQHQKLCRKGWLVQYNMTIYSDKVDIYACVQCGYPISVLVKQDVLYNVIPESVGKLMDAHENDCDPDRFVYY